MPVTVNGAVGKLGRAFDRFATPGGPVERAFLARIRAGLQPEVRRMYQDSADPFGSAWTRNEDGSPAYHTNKMGHAIHLGRVDGGLVVRYTVKWIKAADEGHTWPARQQGAGAAFFDADGKFLSAKQRKRLGGKRTVVIAEGNSARYYVNRRDKATGDRFATLIGRGKLVAGHTVGPRVLPERQQEPRGRMPDKWGDAINGAAALAMNDFLSKATGNG